MKFLARFISYAFHPAGIFVFMPYLLVYKYTNSMLYPLKWVLFSLFFVSLAIFMIVFGIGSGFFSDPDISKQQERYRFYHFSLVLGFVYMLISVSFKGIFFPMSLVAFGILGGILFFDMVNRAAKASVHTAVVSALVITFTVFYPGSIWFVWWIVPIVVWARIFLKKHTLQEAILGCIIGTIITLGIYFVAIKIYGSS